MTADPMTVSRELSGLSSSAAVLEAYSESVMNTFGAPKRVFVRGEACYLWDAKGGVTWTCSLVWQSMRSATRIRLCCPR